MDHRLQIITELITRAGVRSENELMDYLQDNGQVSDEAITINDVPDSDLIRAFNQKDQE